MKPVYPIPKPKNWSAAVKSAPEIPGHVILQKFNLGKKPVHINNLVDNLEHRDRIIEDELSKFWRALGAM
jgi:hypothetical protein